MQHFLSLLDLDTNTARELINKAIILKRQLKNGDINLALQNKTLVMIFEKSSTRTRVSFETGMTQLGGHALFLSPRDSQLGRGEPIADTARVLSGMADAVMIRNDSQQQLEEFAQHASVPVINALTDMLHPCQLLADLMTWQEHRGDFAGKTVTWVGDGNNVCHSWMNAAYLFGFKLQVACPVGYEPDAQLLEQTASHVDVVRDAVAACQATDVIVTDVWASMGQEQEQKIREQVFANYQVNTTMLKAAHPDALFMHCLPAHRGEEVAADVIDGQQSVVWDEAENRLHAQKALLLKLMNPEAYAALG